MPVDYTGPTAYIQDSAEVHSSSKVDYFYVRKVDDREIVNSHQESIVANQGRGFFMQPYIVGRDVPAQPVTLEIVARTEYAAPILTLTMPVYQAKGVVTITPEPGKRYVVAGVLSKDYSAVWIEDESSEEVIGEKIEINGSAKLGFFQK